MSVASNNVNVSSEEGFSLIEVLVTLLVLSFLFAGIFGFLSQLGTIKRMTVSVSEETGLAALESFLRKRIRGARKIPIFSEGFLQQRFFKGDRKGFTFVSEVRRGVSGHGLFDISIKWNEQKTSIFETHAYRRLSKKPSKVSEEFILFQNIEELSISYGSNAFGSEAFSWQEEWNSVRLLPSIVRLDGILKRSDRSKQFSFLFILD